MKYYIRVTIKSNYFRALDSNADSGIVLFDTQVLELIEV